MGFSSFIKFNHSGTACFVEIFCAVPDIQSIAYVGLTRSTAVQTNCYETGTV